MGKYDNHYYFKGYAQNGDERKEVCMKPTAENIANFIMQNLDADITITDELDLPVVTAFGGFINTCKDQEFLLFELQPAIIPIQRGEKEVGEIDKYPMNEVVDENELFD